MEPGELSKSLPVVSDIYDRLVEMQAGRQTVVFAVGGGVVGDTAGFVAATYARGIPFVQIPTTLLAHVDSSVGGKVGINHPKGKNLIGAFHQPLGVVIDTATLKSLPERDYTAGLAEVIKYGVILDEDFFAELEQNLEGIKNRSAEVLQSLIARSCRLKADVVEQDEYEHTGMRAVLNYGHTFGHAFENLCHYGELLHGEAVAIGMIYASRLAERVKLIDESVTRRQRALLEAVGLPTGFAGGTKLQRGRNPQPDAARQKSGLRQAPFRPAHPHRRSQSVSQHPRRGCPRPASGLRPRLKKRGRSGEGEIGRRGDFAARVVLN